MNSGYKKINFCTLFDSNYLHFGLALHSSLVKNCQDFHLYIFAFDKKSEDFLKKASLKNVTIISLKEFEDERLLAIKSSRSKGEYCWTSTASTVLYVLNNFSVASCTYIDSDIFFFSDPKVLLDEMGDKSVLIISHRYPKDRDQSAISGKYCVQFMCFKNNAAGLEVLNWWRDRCIEWCYNRFEDGKFGDQKYLDDWMTRFDCVHELENIGGGVAPWNVSQYKFYNKNNKIFGVEKTNNKEFVLVFYHFHGFKLLNKSSVQLAPKDYKICNDLSCNVYDPYLQNIESAVIAIGDNSDFLSEIKNKDCGWLEKIKLYLLPTKKNIKPRNGAHN